jgi:hypothetical protein
MSERVDIAGFRTFGFVVLRRAFDPDALGAEIDWVLVQASRPAPARRFRYAPMMTAETPVSLALLDRLEAIAAALLGGAVLPTRAKGVLYHGNTPWHADSDARVASLGCAAYLEPLAAESGALRVLPGSHRDEYGKALRALGAAGAPADSLPGHVIATEPGDVIVLDEHLFHASAGGGARRQWRVDYVRDPSGAEAERDTRAYFEDIYPPDWDGGYDVDRFPSYGADWLRSGRPSVDRLKALGVYALAEAQEARARQRV